MVSFFLLKYFPSFIHNILLSVVFCITLFSVFSEATKKSVCVFVSPDEENSRQFNQSLPTTKKQACVVLP